jgi:hypothetical protein
LDIRGIQPVKIRKFPEGRKFLHNIVPRTACADEPVEGSAGQRNPSSEILFVNLQTFMKIKDFPSFGSPPFHDSIINIGRKDK